MDRPPAILDAEGRARRYSWQRSTTAPPAHPKWRMRYYVIGFYLLLFGMWQLVISLHWAPDYLFPSPFQVFKRLYELIREGFMLPSIQATLVRMGIGFSIAGAIGLTIGLIMGISAIAHACMKSLFLGLQTL